MALLRPGHSTQVACWRAGRTNTPARAKSRWTTMSTASMERYLNPCFSFNDPLGIPGRCSWTQSQRRATEASVSSSHDVEAKISPVAVSTSEALSGTIVGCSVFAGIGLSLERGDVRPLDHLVALEILLGAA